MQNAAKIVDNVLASTLGNPAYPRLTQSIQIQCCNATNLHRQVIVQPSSSLTQIRLIRPTASCAAVISDNGTSNPTYGDPKRSEQNASVCHNWQCDLRPVHCQDPFAAVYCIPKRDFWDIRPRDQDVERIALEAPTAIFIKIILLQTCLGPQLSAG
jgi:hypothetical protein